MVYNGINNKNWRTLWKYKSVRKKVRSISLSSPCFLQDILFGDVLISVSVIVDLANKGDVFWIDVLQNVVSTIGVAILVGAIFDFSKNSEAFTLFVSNILRDIVISKDFLNVMSEDEKKNSLELILKPTDLQIEQCASIDLYYKKSIDTFMNLYKTPFKTGLVINIRIVKENGRLMAKGDMTHKIYKVYGEYQPIITTFEREDCQIDDSFIILPTGKKVKLENDSIKETNDKKVIGENGEIAKKYETNIPKEYYSYPYLTVCREITENGNDHWINFHWLSLTICDGIYFKIICQDGTSIKDYLVFDDKNCYDIEINSEKNMMTIISTNWLNSYSGFTITVSDT